jgi:hypothetical protein
VSENLHLAVPGVDGWSYLAFDVDGDREQRVIRAARDSDGAEIELSVPLFVEKGEDIAAVAATVIRARERWEDLQGLGA